MTTDNGIDDILNQKDVKVLKKAFCRVICDQRRDNPDSTTIMSYALFLRTRLKGYMSDEEKLGDYVLGLQENIYNHIVDYICQELVNDKIIEYTENAEEYQIRIAEVDELCADPRNLSL
jgi:hypothetical protein